MKALHFLPAIAMIWVALFICASNAFAQESNSSDKNTIDIFLDDEKLDVEADIPSVDLVLSFKGTNYEIKNYRESFMPELIKTAKQDPF